MKVRLKHHKQIRERIDRIRMFKNLLPLILIKILDRKTLNYTVHNLRLARNRKMSQQNSETLVNEMPFKFHLMDELISNADCQGVDVTD